MKDKVLSIVVICLTITLLLGIIVYSYLNNSDNEIKLVDDYTTFFTIDGCINRYFGYISDNENNKLLNILNKEYIIENNINENNVIEIVDTLNIRNKISSFKSIKMYEKRNKNKTEYYVLGKIYYEEDMDTSKYLSDYYITVIVNENKKTFDISPYDGKIFKEGF